MSKSNLMSASDLAATWRARAASSSSATSLGRITFTMPKPLGSLKTGVMPPGSTPFRASRISARSWVGSTSPIRPPSTAVGSSDFSRASTLKSKPPRSCSWIFSASSADRTRIKRRGTVLGDSCPAEEFRKSRAAPSTAPNIGHTGLANFMAGGRPSEARPSISYHLASGPGSGCLKNRLLARAAR